MQRTCLVLAAVMLITGIAYADPAHLEGGVFIAHYPTALQFSSDPPPEGWCQHYLENYAISSCEDQVNRIDTGDGAIWYVLAAWTEDKEWCGTEFGFGTYKASAFLFSDHGPCYPEDGLEIATDNWPGSNEGTAIVVTGNPWAGNFTPVYCFAGYAYSKGIIPLSMDPTTGFGGTSNCGSPPQAFGAAGFGGMGLFTDGTHVCPQGGEGGGGGAGPGGDETAACCLDEDCRIATAEECEEMGGEWLAEQSFCDPNPCRAASSTAEILPGKINPNSGHWTFLVREFPPDQICRFVLSVGDRTYQGHRSATTTASSSLWEVFYEPLDTTQVPTAEAWSGEGECSQIHVQRQLTWRRHTLDQDSLCIPGMIGTWPRPGLLGYEPGPRERTLGELVGTDPELLQRLQEIGAERFGKASPLPDTTTWVIRHGEPFRIKASGIRYYDIWVGTDHNMPAVALILLEAAGIDKAVPHRRLVVDRFDDPPLAPILECGDPNTDDYCEAVWYLWSSCDHGYGHGMNVVNGWYEEEDGSGIQIGIADQYTDRNHPDFAEKIIEDPGWAIYPGVSDHGTTVASMATAAPNGFCIVGVAPCADLVPYDWPVDIPIWAALAFEFATQGGVLTYGDILIVAWGIPPHEDYEQLILGGIEQARANNIWIVVAEPEDPNPNTWPSAFAGDHVLTVGGSDLDGWLVTGGDPMIMAPSEELCWDIIGGCAGPGYLETSPSKATGLTAGAAALVSCATDGWYVFDRLINFSCLGVVDAYWAICAGTPIHPVQNLQAEQTTYGIYLSWEAGNPTETDRFNVLSAPTCWGRFTLRDCIEVTDPGQIEYGVDLSEPWDVLRTYRVVAELSGRSETAEIEDIQPGNGVPPPADPPAPQNLEGAAEGETMIVSWDRWLGGDEDVEYWVYRRTGSTMEECHDIHYNGYYHTSIPDAPGTCPEGPDTRACCVDNDRWPINTYVYRVATVWMDPSLSPPRPMCYSPISNLVLIPPSSVDVRDERPALERARAVEGAVVVLPNPVVPQMGQLRLAGATPGRGVLEILSPEGRVAQHIALEASREGAVVLPPGVTSRLRTGAYLLRWIPDGGSRKPRAAQKVTVVR